MATYYSRFERYVKPKANVIFARYKFHGRAQAASEPSEQFVTELRLLVKDCNYRDSDEEIRDRIVFGVHSPQVREKLLNIGFELTLGQAIDIARSHELAQAQLKTIANGSTGMCEQTVHAIGRNVEKKKWQRRENGTKGHAASDNVSRREGDSSRSQGCKYCGNKPHSGTETCPAKGKQCKNCSKWNHFAKVCFSRQGKGVHTGEK